MIVEITETALYALSFLLAFVGGLAGYGGLCVYRGAKRRVRDRLDLPRE